jgi:CheY-like chemotaxis protein
VTVRTLVVDDEPDIARMLATLIDISPGFVLVGEARNGLEAIEVARETQPDLVLLDVMMPVLDGIAAMPQLRKVVPAATIVYVTALAPWGFDNPPWGESARADAVISKTWLPSKAMAELRRIMEVDQ